MGNDYTKYNYTCSSNNLAGYGKGILSDIGESTTSIDWTMFLTKYKRKIISADYNLNNGEFNDEGFYVYPYEVKRGCDVEILIDTSGSVNDDMVRAFLRECKNIFRETKIKIGCFDTVFYGFHEIKCTEDIDNFVVEGRGGTDFNVAVDSFSKKSNVKIVFTDGYCDEPKKSMDAIWILWTDKKLNPPGGKVIRLNVDTLNYSNSKKIR